MEKEAEGRKMRVKCPEERGGKGEEREASWEGKKATKEGRKEEKRYPWRSRSRIESLRERREGREE